jgi:ABC-type glutathione transport system ATPase component
MIIMDKGRIAEEGPPERVLQAPVSQIGERYRWLWEARYTERGRRSGRQSDQMQIPAAGTVFGVQKELVAGQ